jgi:hypothetical protein
MVPPVAMMKFLVLVPQIAGMTIQNVQITSKRQVMKKQGDV